MFCSNCGTRLPDDARFCSSCGQKTGTSASPQQTADDFLNRLTPEQRDGLFKGMAEATFAPIQDRMDHFETIAKQGPVTTDDIKNAIEIHKAWTSGNPFIPAEKNLLVQITLPFVLAHEAELLLRQRWFSKETSEKTKQETLKRDYSLYATERMRGVLKAYTKMSDDVIGLILYELKGLGEWLEDETLKNLLLAMRLEKIHIPKDAFTAVFVRLDPRRTQAILDYVSGTMKYVK